MYLLGGLKKPASLETNFPHKFSQWLKWQVLMVKINMVFMVSPYKKFNEARDSSLWRCNVLPEQYGHAFVSLCNK